MERADMWVYITGADPIRVAAFTYWDVERGNQLGVVVSAVSGTQRYHNAYFVPSRTLTVLTTSYNFERLSGAHTRVFSIYARIDRNTYNCWRQNRSTSEISVWACLLRE